MASLKITYKDPAQLKPRARNPRTHTARQIRQIQASIKEFGFINPVLIDGTGGIIAGHGRVEAAKLVGMSDVPTVRVDHLTPAQIRAYVIADNKLAENAGWDRELLALEIQELSVELNFDVTVTGFETAEVDLLIGELNEDASDDADELPEIDRSVPAVTQRRRAAEPEVDRGLHLSMLAIELQGLVDLDFEIELTGFSLAEVDIVLDEARESATDGADATAEDTIPIYRHDVPAVSKIGDLWLLGRHKLICGDARDGGAYDLLMGGDAVDLICTDPPFNVPIDGHVCGSGRIRHRDLAMGAAEMSAWFSATGLSTAFI